MERLLNEFFQAPPVKRVIAVVAELCTFERVVLLTSLFTFATYASVLSLPSQLILPVLFLAVLVVPRLLSNPWFWGVVTVVLFYGSVVNWSTNDNHQWLFVLWSLTIMLVYGWVSEPERVRVLRSNAKWMLILVMLLAVVQKSLEPSYIDGSFFAYKLLVDFRFWYMSESLALISPEVLQQNAMNINEMLLNPLSTAVTIHTNQVVFWLGQFITWWVYIVELLIALLLLIRSSVAQQWAHITNIYFIFVTYTLAPVLAFASLLTVLGFLLTYDRYPRLRFWYGITFVYLCVLLVMW